MAGVVLQRALSERGMICMRRPRSRSKRCCGTSGYPNQLWDPCCGPGNIVNVLRAAGHEVIGSDLLWTTATRLTSTAAIS